MRIKLGSRRLAAMAAGSAVAIVFLAGAASAAPKRARARESAVGVEARGIDPLAALRNRWGLDLRDAQGRPVSPGVMARELKKASAHAAADSTYASKLPRARGAALFFELLEALGLSLKPPPLPLPTVSRAQPLNLRPPRIMVFILFLGLVASVCRPSRRPAVSYLHSASRAPMVLRC